MGRWMDGWMDGYVESGWGGGAVSGHTETVEQKPCHTIHVDLPCSDVQ